MINMELVRRRTWIFFDIRRDLNSFKKRTHLTGVSYSTIIATFLDAARVSGEAGNLPSPPWLGRYAALFICANLISPGSPGVPVGPALTQTGSVGARQTAAATAFASAPPAVAGARRLS